MKVILRGEIKSPKALVSVRVWTQAAAQRCLCLLDHILAVDQGLEGR